MAETMKERKDMDPQYMWDLSTLFKNDEEWNNALPELDEMIKKLKEYMVTSCDDENDQQNDATDPKLDNN